MRLWFRLLQILGFQQHETVQQQPIIPICAVSGTQQKPEYDFATDDSLWKYVSPSVSFQDLHYIPNDLTDLTGHISIRGGQGQLRAQAVAALAALSQAFYDQFHKPLVVISSYRGFNVQKRLLGGYSDEYGTGRASSFSAKPGYSEHQLGLTVDLINIPTNPEVYSGYESYFDRMRNNAHLYGWTQSYQKGRQIDGYIVEPRHRRYVGVDLATYLWENKMTFSEYVTFWNTRKGN